MDDRPGRTYELRRRQVPVTNGDNNQYRFEATYLPGARIQIIDRNMRDLFAGMDGRESVVGNKRARTVEATEAAIQGLPEVTRRNKMLRQAECAVCLKELDDLDKLRAMPCAHAFHEECIFRWLRRNAICPLCRRSLPIQDKNEGSDHLNIADP